eukprot:5492662-Lingulodinium_polyedra.AAC.1
MLATPCASFSIARDRTRPIRSRTRPWGLPVLSPEDQKRMSYGNKCAQATIKIIRWCVRSK